jgi:hypothetical protein
VNPSSTHEVSSGTVVELSELKVLVLEDDKRSLSELLFPGELTKTKVAIRERASEAIPPNRPRRFARDDRASPEIGVPPLV